MSVDLSQFHQVFFEESHEGLDVMESALLNIDVSNIESETINEIFRAAHSIKGGSGTFGFNEIAEFTHVVETLLDLIRSDQYVMQQENVDLFLQSVDCIRSMINQFEEGSACDTERATELKAQFEVLLNGDSGDDVEAQAEGGSEAEAGNVSGEAEPGGKGWQIYFKPDIDILKTGNEPVRMFRELAELGELSVTAVTDEIPDLGSLDPEGCYLAWNLTLLANVEESQVSEIFEWVVDDSELVIKPLESNVETSIESPESVSTENKTQAANPDSEKQVAPKQAVVEKKEVKAKKESKAENVSIRVGTDKIDKLINMVGELVITQSMLGELGNDFSVENLPKLLAGLDELSQHTRELQESVMSIRMLPISFAFSRFPRLVHDMSQSLSKKVELVLQGEHTELDKTVMEKISDPLVHLVRNSLDHGIESPEQRLASGKSEMGKITLSAFHQGGNIVIQIIDDGAGLNRDRILGKALENGLVSEHDNLTDEQIYDLVFKAGFSTAEAVTDISGRGVGMDVVRRNINELSGSVEVESTPGEGSVFTIRLPLTLAILDGQLLSVGSNVYILPLVSIVESIQAQDQTIHRISGGSDVLRLRDEYVPIIRLWDIFNLKPDSTKTEDGLLVVAEFENTKFAIMIDELLAQQQVVIKSLNDNYTTVEGLSGATILGNGTVALILDIGGLIKLAGVTKDQFQKVEDSGSIEAA